MLSTVISTESHSSSLFLVKLILMHPWRPRGISTDGDPADRPWIYEDDVDRNAHLLLFLNLKVGKQFPAICRGCILLAGSAC